MVSVMAYEGPGGASIEFLHDVTTDAITQVTITGGEGGCGLAVHLKGSLTPDVPDMAAAAAPGEVQVLPVSNLTLSMVASAQGNSPPNVPA